MSTNKINVTFNTLSGQHISEAATIAVEATEYMKQHKWIDRAILIHNDTELPLMGRTAAQVVETFYMLREKINEHK